MATASVPNDENALNFFVLGDWGGIPIIPFTTHIQKRVAGSMVRRSQTTSTDFILALGDNFYFKGVKSVDDKRFERTFERVYKDQSLQIPWYVIAGNHDWKGNVAAQIEYSTRSERWNFPDYFYNFTKTTKNGVTAAFLMLDTELMRDDPKWYKWTAEKLDYYDKLGVNYLFVSGHHPVWSAGISGPTSYLVDNLEPLLYKYHVSAYFAGHNHALERYEVSKNGHNIPFLISGDAALNFPGKPHVNDVPEGSMKFFDSPWYGGFLSIKVTKENAVGEFIYAWDDTIPDSFKILPRTK